MSSFALYEWKELPVPVPTQEEMLAGLGPLMVEADLIDDVPEPSDLGAMSVLQFDSVDLLQLYFKIEAKWEIRFETKQLQLWLATFTERGQTATVKDAVSWVVAESKRRPGTT